jgi:pimeloyl-ACP methyl ester carboxylesterase
VNQLVHIDSVEVGMEVLNRSRASFRSGSDDCVAWHYPGTNGACVVMAPGGAVPKEPGTDRFAARFQQAGYTVLAIDFRHFGASGGSPRQVIRPRAQLADLRAAIDFAGALPEVDADRVALWGFSLAGGHAVRLAAESRVRAAIAQTPLVDAFASSPNALRHESVGVVLGFPFLALWDVLGGVFGRSPRLVPLTGPRGTVAMLTTPDSQDAFRALDPDNRYPGWDGGGVAARSVLRIGAYRPGRRAGRVDCPLLVVVADDDQSVLAAPAVRVSERAAKSELVRVTGGHYAPFLDAHETVVAAEVDFLNRHLLA